MIKKKILIPLNSDIFIRNYLTTNVFKNLKNNFDIIFCAKEGGVSIKKFFKTSNFAGFYKFSKKENKYYDNFCLKYLLKNKNKTNTVRISLSVILNFIFFTKKYKSIFINLPIIFFFYFKRCLQVFLYYIIYNLLKKKIFYKKKINSKITFLIKKYKPDLILIPSQGHDIGYHEFLIESKKQKIKSCAIIDNWDNMSSRIHTDPKADHYLVWGEQSKTFAQKYQGIDKSKINLIGSARFNNYFQKRNELVKSYFKFNYALFMEGFGIQEDLNFFFTKIDYEIGKLKNFKLIYRPHPWRKNQKNIDLENFKNIILDPQLEYFYKKKMSHTSIQPDLNYYPSLIKNSSFIIAAPSTMVIESTIFYKPIVLLAYDEKSKFGNYSYLKNIEHFNGIEKFPNVIICKNINNLNQIFKRILNMRTFNKKNIDFLRNYYLYNNNIDFPTRLEIFIKKIIIKKNGIRTFNI